MDFLNQAIGQVRELFLSMTPAARVTALLLLGVIGVSLGYLFQHHSTGPGYFLFNGEFLSSHDADRAAAAIAQAGLEDFERVGNRIRVPIGKKGAYLAAVADAGALPTNFDSLLKDALNLGPFVDRKTRQQQYKAAREQQLSMMVRLMDGVEDAKVIYDFSELRGLSRKRQVTATVSVRPEPGEELNTRRQKMIRKAVAGAIQDLSLNDVTVINQTDGSSLDGGADVMADAFDDPYFQTRVNYERLMKNNIESLLHDIPGIRVQVTAELADTLQRTTRSTKPSGDGVAMRETGQDEETTSTKTEDGGRPGLAAQGPSRNGEQTELAKTENKTTNNSHQTENFIGYTEDNSVLAGLIPEQVRVAIAIPSNYLVSVWRESAENAGENDKPEKAARDLIEGDLRTQIKGLVTSLLPRQPTGTNPYPAVEVTVFESITPEPFEAPSTAGLAMTWLSQNMSGMMMGGLALVSLVMLRSIVKSVPPSDPAPALGSPSLSIHRGESGGAEASTNEGEESNDESRPRLKLKKGVSLKDDLTDIVREDPEAAAAILRNWISNAG